MMLLVLDCRYGAHVDVFSRCAIFPLSVAGLHILSLKNCGNLGTGFGTDYVGNISRLPEARLRSSKWDSLLQSLSTTKSFRLRSVIESFQFASQSSTGGNTQFHGNGLSKGSRRSMATW